jgi:hypothetical protein
LHCAQLQKLQLLHCVCWYCLFPCCSQRVSQWVKHAAAHAAAPAESDLRQHPATPRYGHTSAPEEDEEPQQQQQQLRAGYTAIGGAASAISSATGDASATGGESAGQGVGGAADAGMLGILPDGSEQEEDLAVDAR